MRRITLHVEFDVEERLPQGTVEALLQDLINHITAEESTLMEDYGPKAWGGYDGAYVREARVTRTKIDTI